MTLNKEFFFGGKAIFTLEIPSEFQREHEGVNPHYTFKIDHVDANGKFPEAWFAKLLVGPDNFHNYKTFGLVNKKGGQVKLTKKTNLKDDTWAVRFFRRIIACVTQDNVNAITDTGFELHHEGKCGKCGRRLTTPESVKTGIGPICAAK